VLDGVYVVQAGFLEEPPKVIRRRPRLTLVTACGGTDVSHAEVACLIIIAVGRDRGPLKMLLAPLLFAFGALLGAVDGNVEWRLPITTPTSLLHRGTTSSSVVGG
jgi:hypothetical protein